MRIIKSYKLFESQEREEGIDPVEMLIRVSPELSGDKFTRVIAPRIRTIAGSRNPEKIQNAIDSIKNIAIRKFGGYQDTIPMPEVLDRFVNHYIEKPDGILDMRAIENILDRISSKIRKGIVRSNRRIGKDQIDSFTDKLMTVLEKQGIKDDDVKKQIKKIYTWAIPIMLHFYNPDEVKTFKYMQEGVLFNEDELKTFLEDYSNPDVTTPKEGGIKPGFLHGKKAKKIQAK